MCGMELYQMKVSFIAENQCFEIPANVGQVHKY